MITTKNLIPSLTLLSSLTLGGFVGLLTDRADLFADCREDALLLEALDWLLLLPSYNEGALEDIAPAVKSVCTVRGGGEGLCCGLGEGDRFIEVDGDDRIDIAMGAVENRSGDVGDAGIVDDGDAWAERRLLLLPCELKDSRELGLCKRSGVDE